MMVRMSEGDGTVDIPSKVRAWDLPTRLFHWLLVLLVLLSWATWRYSEALGDPALKLHRWNGHAILVLVVWRVLWGLFGSSTSRFSAWLWWPWTAAGYGFRLLRGRTPPPNTTRSAPTWSGCSRRDGAGVRASSSSAPTSPPARSTA
jgi:cytochrome b561